MVCTLWFTQPGYIEPLFRVGRRVCGIRCGIEDDAEVGIGYLDDLLKIRCLLRNFVNEYVLIRLRGVPRVWTRRNAQRVDAVVPGGQNQQRSIIRTHDGGGGLAGVPIGPAGHARIQPNEFGTVGANGLIC